MSWDAAIVLPKNRDLDAVFETAVDLQCLPMGSVSDIQSLIDRVLGSAYWSNNIEARVVMPGGGLLKLCLETAKYRFLLDAAYAGQDVDEAMAERLNRYRPHGSEQVIQIRAEARHRGDPVELLMRLCRAGGWLLWDFESGRLVGPDDPELARHSWERFLRFLAHVKSKIGGRSPDELK